MFGNLTLGTCLAHQLQDYGLWSTQHNLFFHKLLRGDYSLRHFSTQMSWTSWHILHVDVGLFDWNEIQDLDQTDFVGSNEMCVDIIYFDTFYWANMFLPKLTIYELYLHNALQFLVDRAFHCSTRFVGAASLTAFLKSTWKLNFKFRCINDHSDIWVLHWK